MPFDSLTPFADPPDAERLRSAFSEPPKRFGTASGPRVRQTLNAPLRSELREKAEHLRFRLALRGRSDPNECLSPEVGPRERLEVLNIVAADCDVGIGSKLSAWLLNDSVRTRILRSRAAQQVAEALVIERQQTDDPVTAVLHDLYVQPAVLLDTLTTARARILLTALGWVGDHVPQAPNPEEVRLRLESLARREEYSRTTSDGFFGREREMKRLSGFLRAPLEHTERARLAHIWGGGGIGKSALIAALALARLHEDPKAVLVHFDFDRGDLDLNRPSTLDLELLRQAGSVDLAIDQSLKGRRERIRALMGEELAYGSALEIGRQSFASEHVESFSTSILAQALFWLNERRRPLILIFDTLEQVEAGGPGFLYSLKAWLENVTFNCGAPEVRVLIAGRAKPSRVWLSTDPHPLSIELGELKRPGALLLLEHRDVPGEIAGQLYEVFGGNPLVLCLASELFGKLGAEKIRAIADEAKRGGMPAQLVQGVLYDRFLRHLEGDARKYAHPGLVLPEMTVPLIRAVLGPSIGEPDISETRAKEIFDALSRAGWLVRLSRDGSTLAQRPDVRRVMLRLMSSDPRRRQSIRRIRAKAIEWHKRQGPEQRGPRLYHELMGVQNREELAAFDQEDFYGVSSYLRLYIEDLPDVARAYVQARLSATLGAEEALRALPENAWARYLTGDKGQLGEGDRLVEASDPLIALNLWKRRPIGKPEQPPTFVIQAFAETAAWDGAGVDIETIVSACQPLADNAESIRRLEWVTKLAMMSRPGPLSEPHANLIRRTLEESLDVEQVTTLAALAGVCEAFLVNGAKPIVPDRIVAGSFALESEIRLQLIRGRVFGAALRWSPHVDALVSIQRDWSLVLSKQPWSLIDPVLRAGELLQGDSMARIQRQLDSLHGAPLDALPRVLRELRTKVRFEIGTGPWNDPSRLAGVLLLRGRTPELHRPVRQALCEALDHVDLITKFIQRFRPNLSICPVDLEPDVFTARASKDPALCFLSIAQFADWASVLGSLLDAALEVVPSHLKLSRVRSTWQTWDRAICGGFLSDWNLISTGLDKTTIEHGEAKPRYHRALAITEKSLSPEHAELAARLINQAHLYRDKGKYSKAEPLYERALAILEKALGPEHAEVATSLNNLARLYYRQGQYAKAEPLYQRALAILERAVGPERAEVEASLNNNLAVLYNSQGQYAKAEPLYLRALASWEKVLEPEHADVATSLNNLAGLYDSQDQYAKAEPLYLRALAIREKALGPEHAEVAASLNNLAVLYDNQGQYAKAEPLYLRALAIREKALGLAHPDVAASLTNLAQLYYSQGQYARAEPLYERALTIWAEALGPEHPQVATYLEKLALCLRAMDRHEEATRLEASAKAIWRKMKAK